MLRSRLKGMWDRSWGWFLVSVAVLAGAIYYDTVQKQQDYVTCQTALNRAFIESLSARSAVSTASDSAQSSILLGVSNLFLLPPTEDKSELMKRDREFRKLFSDYRKATEDVAIVRSANPYPDLTRNNC